MKTVNAIASHYNITEEFYDCQTNEQGEVIALELFDGEYDDFPSRDYVLQFASHFKQLKRLHIDIFDCVISTLQPLEGLKYIETLYFECSSTLSDLESVYHFPNLKSLTVYSSEISDLTPLIACKHLTSIGLPNAHISDISCLKQLPNLSGLDFAKNSISNIDVLSTLKNLTSIACSYNNIENIEALSGLTELKYIVLTGNSIQDLNPIAQSTQVVNLLINKNKVKDIRVLQNHLALKHINLSENNITDISVLKDKTNLEVVTLSKNPIKSLNPLTKLTAIRHLYASGLQLNDKEKLTTFESEIWYLDLSNNQLTDGTCLENQHKLLQLNLSNNALKAFAWLKNMSRIKHLDLSNNALKEPFPIYYLYGADAIDLRGNTFGNTVYERHQGLASHSSIYTNTPTNEDHKLITDLEKTVADYYYEKGDLDSALAYYYMSGNYNNKTVFDIYLRKLLTTPQDDLVYIKYYFYKIVMAFDKTLVKPEEFTKLYKQIGDCLGTLSNTTQREHLLNALEHLNKGHRTNPSTIFNPLELYFYERKHPKPYITDEMLFLKGTGFATDRISREQLDKGVFYLKALHTRNSPFFYTLKNRIRTTLNNQFAYTDTERKAHDYYMDLIHHIGQRTIESPEHEPVTIAIGVEIKQGYKFAYYDADLVKQLNIPTPYDTEDQTPGWAKSKNLLNYILLGLLILMVVKALRWF